MTRGQLHRLIERYRKHTPARAGKKHLLERVAKELQVPANLGLERMLEGPSSHWWGPECQELEDLIVRAVKRHEAKYQKYQQGGAHEEAVADGSRERV